MMKCSFLVNICTLLPSLTLSLNGITLCIEEGSLAVAIIIGVSCFISFTMSSETLVTISPITNQPILTRTGLSDADIALLPAIATQAFNSYRQIPLVQRQAIVRKALDLITQKKDVLAREITEQMGRPIAYTAKEITTAVARGEYLLKLSNQCLKDTEGEAEVGFKRYIRKCPVGPVLILFAWNVCCLFSSVKFFHRS